MIYVKPVSCDRIPIDTPKECWPRTQFDFLRFPSSGSRIVGVNVAMFRMEYGILILGRKWKRKGPMSDISRLLTPHFSEVLKAQNDG